MRTKILNGDDPLLRVAEVIFNEGDSRSFTVEGDDLGNGFMDTSCHAGWYVAGQFISSYPGMGDRVRRNAIGCTHQTDPDEPHIFPKAEVTVRCTKGPGRILFIDQHDKSTPLRFRQELVVGEYHFDRDGVLVQSVDGAIAHFTAGDTIYQKPGTPALALEIV